jgi:HSP20 family molecular chaperone IbpA
MPLRDPRASLLADAIDLLREADRLHSQFFTFSLGDAAACWSPPVDIIESDRAVTIRVALPGVGADSVSVTSDGATLRVVALRPLDASPGDRIHRLEIPHGRFERRIELPAGRYDIEGRDLADGCLVIRLRRLA